MSVRDHRPMPLCTLGRVQEDHVAAIAEVLGQARVRGVMCWLRGGWAMDFTLGRWTRRHEDVDFFVPTESLDLMADGLCAAGWTEVGDSPRDQQRDLWRDGVDLGIAPVTVDDDGRPLVGGGPWRGAQYPADMLSGAVVRTWAGVTVSVISPESQIEIKRMMPQWVPGMRRRHKDALDIARLQAFLDAAG